MPNFLHRLRPFSIALLSALILSPAIADTASGPSGYKLTATWKPGGEGRWDYLAVDPDAGRLYIARENRIQVLDTTTGKLIGEVPGIDGAHGVALVFGLKRGFATSGRDGKVIVFDTTTLKRVGEPLNAGTKPDAIVYDGGSNRVFAMNGGSSNTTVIDATSARVIGTIALPGQPEFAVSDGLGRVYVNLEDKSQVVGIDAQVMKVDGDYPLAPGVGPTGLAIDRVGHHLFSGCANQKLVVLDDTAGTVLAALPIGAHVDATGFDPGTGYAFSSNGDGTLTVVGLAPSGDFRVIDNIPTKVGARTMALDVKTHAIYLCTADFAPPDPASHGRPKPLPGTFVVLKFTR